MPNGRGGNLTQPLKKIILNEPGPINLGVYERTSDNVMMLQFKHHGLTLPFLPGTRFNATRNQPPILKVVTVTLNRVKPVDPSVYEYGIQVQSRHYHPGVQNSFMFPHTKFYGGKRFNLGGTGATIIDADLDAMVKDIVDQINNDIGVTRRPEFQYPGAHVTAVAGATGTATFVLTQRYADVTFEVIVKPAIGTTVINTRGVPEVLSNDEVFRVFSHLPNFGFLAQETWPVNLPIRDARYVRINIDVPMEHYDLHGASHTGGFINAIEVYMPVAAFDSATRLWALVGKRAMEPGTGVSLSGLFGLWEGITPPL